MKHTFCEKKVLQKGNDVLLVSRYNIWDNIGILNVNELNELSPNFTTAFTTKFYKLNIWHDFITTTVPSTQLRDSHEIAFDRIKVWLSFY